MAGLTYGERYEIGVTVLDGSAYSFESRIFTLTESPGTADIGEDLDFVSGSRDDGLVSLVYRARNFEAVCDNI